jgi:4-hydroxy-tetrahydrodipicolinate reductase
MRAIVLGDGPMGRVMAAGLVERGAEVVAVLGRPATSHPARAFDGVEVAFDFSRGDAVLANVASGLAGGCRRFVIGSTAWAVAPAEIDGVLVRHGAAAVTAANFSPGVNLLTRLVESATQMFGALPEYDPYVLEWHRRGKADRPSGTALELSRRILAVHPGKKRIADHARSGALEADELEVSSLRAGASPGMHLVGFDAPGETVELRLTARDRSAYALGALAAADWLLRAPRAPGIHAFDTVVDGLVASGSPPAATSAGTSPPAPTDRRADTSPVAMPMG